MLRKYNIKNKLSVCATVDGGLIRENLLLNHANGLATDKTNFVKAG